MEQNPIQKLIGDAGGSAAFTEMTDVPKRTVYRWQSGQSVPPDWAMALIRDRINARMK